MGSGDSYLSTPSILLFADSPAGFAEQRRAIHRLDGRIGAAEPIVGAIARIEESCDVGAVVVDASVETPELNGLLDRLDLAAREGRYGSIVTITPDLIDLAAALCPHPSVAILCGGGQVENVAALALALAGSGRVPQLAGEGGQNRLRQLSDEVGRIGRALANLSDGEQGGRHVSLPPLEANGTEPTAPMLRGYIRARRMREQFFPAELFADPAWDMLLDLMAARIEGRKVAVSSLCIAAAVPATTGLRWIKTLTDEGLFVRIADPQDGRRVFIELSDATVRAMSGYFQALNRAGMVGG